MEDSKLVNIIKGLVIDGVAKANSGHPGGAMSSVDFAYVLFSEFLKFNPDSPDWKGRDRFVLSAGHESMLLYSFLHLIGWLPMEELTRFRQLHSKTPGHPENHLTPGVECTTGPLGQGAAMSVGMAIANAHLGGVCGTDLFGQKTYALLGDGCMQEDVTLGAASLAGHLGLGNLVWYYDKNRIQISGKISRSTSDDEVKIFEGFGWKVITIDGHDHGAIRAALASAHGQGACPTLIVGNTTIARGAATMEGSHKTHGSPLPSQEVVSTKLALGLDPEQLFYCPDDAIEYFRRNFGRLREHAAAWDNKLAGWLTQPGNQEIFDKYWNPPSANNLPKIAWDTAKNEATRNSFGRIIEEWADSLGGLMGGSADLEPSNMTGAFAAKVSDFTKENRAGRNLSFGVREFPMSAIANGMALHGGFIPFDATFLTFSDYSRAALRLGALQKVRVIHEFSHDSFYLGEDGPTHQAIEHVMSLRLIPNFYVMRPADPRETEVMMRCAVELEAPSALCLTRQSVPHLPVSDTVVGDAARGAYTVRDCPNPEFIIIASGSEVHLALEVANALPDQRIRVVSMPCWELFDNEAPTYRDLVLPPQVQKRISIEAGATLGWQKYTGSQGLQIGIDHFGDSAPAEQLAELYGFTKDQVIARIVNHRW